MKYIILKGKNKDIILGFTKEAENMAKKNIN